MGRFLLLILLAFMCSCAKPTAKREFKTEPAFSTKITDPQIKVITDEYFRLSIQNHISFSHNVSIGFSSIDSDRVIGTCLYQDSFREIDLDSDFWDRSTWNQKVALVYHELTHCYCERDHDFDNGEKYPDGSLRYLLDTILKKQPISVLKPRGYFEDSCPKSIMHPVIVEDECFEKHYDHYVKEMFARCKPF